MNNLDQARRTLEWAQALDDAARANARIATVNFALSVVLVLLWGLLFVAQ